MSHPVPCHAIRVLGLWVLAPTHNGTAALPLAQQGWGDGTSGSHPLTLAPQANLTFALSRNAAGVHLHFTSPFRSSAELRSTSSTLHVILLPYFASCSSKIKMMYTGDMYGVGGFGAEDGERVASIMMIMNLLGLGSRDPKLCACRSFMYV